LAGVSGRPDHSGTITAPEPLAPDHELDSFDSGVAPLITIDEAAKMLR
jgi:hypothetical protein